MTSLFSSAALQNFIMKKSITITQPDDWHVHFREGDSLENTVAATAASFKRALVMPNLKKPLTTVKQISNYRNQVLAAADNNFTPYFTLYLTDTLALNELELAHQNNFILGTKLYPAGATTNSTAGVNSITSLYPLFEHMQALDLVLQIHGETTKDDIFYREACFIEEHLAPLIKNFPKLRIVLEHISSKAACDFVFQTPENIAATITIHHLLYNRNDLLSGGIKPHYYCLPILKRKSDQSALISAALSGNHKFFLGTDSAPHTIQNKENACGCAGIYSAPYAMPLYTEFFDSFDKMELLENFSSHYGANFYQLPKNKGVIHLEKQSQKIPDFLKIGTEKVQPIKANQTIAWRQIND